MHDTLTTAFEAAGRDLPPLARSILAGRLADLRAGRYQYAGLPPSHPAGGTARPPAEAEVSAERERELLGLTAAGRQLLRDRDREQPPALDARDRQLLAGSTIGRRLLAERDRTATWCPDPGTR